MLFVAAFAPELEALVADAQREAVGVGLVEAALGAARVLAARRPSSVVLVGTAGAYPRQPMTLGIGDVVVGTRVLLASASGALVPAMPTSVATNAELTARVVAQRVTIATTLSITTDDAVAHALAQATAAEVEHLEAFAVARACADANVPFTVVLGIANIVGSRGRAEWREHHQRASAAACRVAALLRSPTTGPSPG